MSRFDKVKFSELPIGAKFRFHRRGLIYTKKSKTTYDENYGTVRVADDIDVMREDADAPTPPTPPTQKPDGYYGPGTRVYFLPDNRVSIVGTLGMAELNMIVNELASRLD